MYRHKREFTSVSVALSNILAHPNITLMDLDLIKEMVSSDKYLIMEKEKDLFEVFFSIVRRGLVVSEGNEWKNKRKLLSNVFNHDFITSHIPMMITIADQVFDDFESKYWDNNPEDR